MATFVSTPAILAQQAPVQAVPLASASVGAAAAPAVSANSPAAQATGLVFTTGKLLAACAVVVAGTRVARRFKRERANLRQRFVQLRSRGGEVGDVSQTAAVETESVVPPGMYCESGERCIRRKTRTMMVGEVKVGSEHRLTTQTMANTLTHDVEATVAQIKKCADAGIDIVRVTVQGMREAKACEHIKRRLLEDGYTTPIVADIHFTPKVALVAAEFVDKIRINPGNFADGRKSFDTITELTDEDVAEARKEIEEAFVPLVLKLKEKNKALRIGVNHGSMAERILFQYGDSPEGMVASAVEFAEICRKYDYHNFCFSMKSSNPQVMVQAYRLLAKEMYLRGWDYPLHLGVTEAGGGADGRIKSAVGIGALLLDGLGDTMRVSLTEDPEFEAAPTNALRRVAEAAHGHGVDVPFTETERQEGKTSRRKCDFPIDVPLNADGSVLVVLTEKELADANHAALCEKLGLKVRGDGELQKEFKSVDAVVLDGPVTSETAVQRLLDLPMGVLCRPGEVVPEGVTLLHDADAVSAAGALPDRLGGHAVVFSGQEELSTIDSALRNANPRLILLKPTSQVGATFVARRFFSRLQELNSKAPVMLWFRYNDYNDIADEEACCTSDAVVVRASADFGSLFVDQLGEGMLWEADALSPGDLLESSFNLLQASRMRISKTEFISCPSCGRTLFNLQDTTARIQERTGHLPGVRVAVMGCIVNGPGEMADADFGYVGSGVGKVDLYVNYDCVKRGIPSEDAVDALVDLIKAHGKWQEPAAEEEADVLCPAIDG
eukprot:TRINITY_DN2062_c0_g1_i2.p1 TRINITY_DN2062_c0_g1~~TRINITY_DN2062_c0_g1_i2.p1  ORF type:complete len:804 (-),score=176.51 TRINITY_DN2062_c0_g1_i2:334-2676(-)